MFAQWMDGSWCGGWPMGGFFMMIMMVLFWGLLIAGGIALVRWITVNQRERAGDHPSSAMELLKKRYAKGEITREEFEQMRKDIL